MGGMMGGMCGNMKGMPAMGGMMSMRGKMGGMAGMRGGIDMMTWPPMHKSCRTPEFYLHRSEGLGLSDEQVAALRKLQAALRKEQILKGAAVKALELDLSEIVTMTDFKLPDAVAKLKEIEKARLELRSTVLKYSSDARDQLSPEQLEKVKEPFPRFEVPPEHSADTYFEYVARQGFEKRRPRLEEGADDVLAGGADGDAVRSFVIRAEPEALPHRNGFGCAHARAIVEAAAAVGDRLDPIDEASHELAVVVCVARAEVEVPVWGDGARRTRGDAELALEARVEVERA